MNAWPLCRAQDATRAFGDAVGPAIRGAQQEARTEEERAAAEAAEAAEAAAREAEQLRRWDARLRERERDAQAEREDA